uniref:Uncharacterized protein n=1 Tax=Rhipicephalus microplus TaxID=6941 RepID=A0A6G5AEZ7_RHIMP
MLGFLGSVPEHELFIDTIIYTTVKAEEKVPPYFKSTKFVLKPKMKKRTTLYKKFQIIFNNPNTSTYVFDSSITYMPVLTHVHAHTHTHTCVCSRMVWYKDFTEKLCMYNKVLEQDEHGAITFLQTQGQTRAKETAHAMTIP